MRIKWSVGCVAVCLAGQVGGQVRAQAVLEPEGWLGRALLIERQEPKPSVKWSPFKVVELKRPAAELPHAEGEPGIAVWSEGRSRRVEIECSGQSFAWEDLRPGSSAQLEFGCAGRRYRAQVGSVVMDAPGPAKTVEPTVVRHAPAGDQSLGKEPGPSPSAPPGKAQGPEAMDKDHPPITEGLEVPA